MAKNSAPPDTYFIIDFDSTFVSVEALDELAKKALKGHSRAKELQQEITTLTTQGMNGEIDFRTSLVRRLEKFAATKNHLEALVRVLKKSVSASIARNKPFFRKNADRIFIISGGFHEYIDPVVAGYGITSDHVLANTFTFNNEGMITGFDEKNPLSQAGGKSDVIKKLDLHGRIYVIGDGATDLEIKTSGNATKFFAFTENVKRPEIVANADKEIPNFDEFLYQLKLPASVSYPKNRIKVLLLEKIHQDAVKAFETEGFSVESIQGALGEEELCKKIKDVSILGIRSKTKVTKKVLDSANKLLVVGAFCIGTNQIDLEAAARVGVAVFNAPYSNTRSVVELAIGNMLSLIRRTFEKSEKLHKGEWDKSADGCFEIRSKKLGIIGYGNIGSQLSVVAEALGMEVYFYDTIEKLSLGNAQKCNSMTELLKKSDIISIHVDGRKENTNLIGSKEFAQMKPGVLFINSARGHVVDVQALANAVKSKHVGGAAVDVFPYEPKTNDEQFETPLQGLSNVILTPHIGGSTLEAQINIAHFVSKRLIQFVNHGDTTLSVNFPELQLPPLHTGSRFMHIHENIPGIMAQITNVLAEKKINIEGQYLQTSSQIGYVITDVGQKYSKPVEAALRAIPGTIRLRVLY